MRPQIYASAAHSGYETPHFVSSLTTYPTPQGAMIQTLFILNSSGTIVMRKDYRGHSSRSVVDFFWDEVCRAPSPVDVSPVLTAPRNYLFHVYRGGLFYLAPVAGKCSLYNNHCYITLFE